MGLKGYRTYRDDYVDNGVEVLEILSSEFEPDFYNRHTIQVWDASNSNNININKWKGVTLDNRSLHEIYIVNNSNSLVSLKFSANYVLQDEDAIDTAGFYIIDIGAGGTAHFYCTAILHKNNLIFDMRTGSQDDKKL